MQWIRDLNAGLAVYGHTGLAAVSSRIILGGFVILMWPFLLVGLVLAIPLKVMRGCLSCLFSLVLLPMNLLHLLLLVPLLGTSCLWNKAPLLRPVLMVISIPIAVVDAVYLLTMVGTLEDVDAIDVMIMTPLSWPATARAFRRAPSITTDQNEF
jgi:hypothetical protein